MGTDDGNLGIKELVTTRLAAEVVAVLAMVRTRCFVYLALFGVCRQQVFCLCGSVCLLIGEGASGWTEVTMDSGGERPDLVTFYSNQGRDLSKRSSTACFVVNRIESVGT